jgi:hypothetical protein
VHELQQAIEWHRVLQSLDADDWSQLGKWFEDVGSRVEEQRSSCNLEVDLESFLGLQWAAVTEWLLVDSLDQVPRSLEESLLVQGRALKRRHLLLQVSVMVVWSSSLLDSQLQDEYSLLQDVLCFLVEPFLAVTVFLHWKQCEQGVLSLLD